MLDFTKQQIGQLSLLKRARARRAQAPAKRTKNIIIQQKQAPTRSSVGFQRSSSNPVGFKRRLGPLSITTECVYPTALGKKVKR